MANELRDLRAKITVETDVVLDSLAKITGRDRSEIVREWLHDKALEQIQVSSLVQTKLRAEGITAASEGAPGRNAL